MGQVTVITGIILSILPLFGQEQPAKPAWQAQRVVSLEYPRLAALGRIQGVVEVECLLDEDGSVRSARVIRGHDLLAKAARENVMKWRFQRTSHNGTGSVPSSVTVEYTFRLPGACEPPCPTTFVFEFPNKALVERDAPWLQPNSGADGSTLVPRCPEAVARR